MNTPARTPNGPRTRKAPAAAIALLLASLGVWELSPKQDPGVPYRDIAGIWTVCKGITGPDVIPTKRYSPEECTRLEERFVARMNERIGHCTGPLNLREWVAWGHFTYNVGTPAFCNSTAAKHLRAGNYIQACGQMKRWTWTTKNGVKVNCRLPQHKCAGIPNRRDYEYDLCMEAQR